MKFSKNVNNKKHAPKLIFFIEKKMGKIWIIFDIKNWLWNSEIGIFRTLDLERMLIWQFFYLWKSAIFHSFDAEVDEKFLYVIYYLSTFYFNLSSTLIFSAKKSLLKTIHLISAVDILQLYTLQFLQYTFFSLWRKFFFLRTVLQAI